MEKSKPNGKATQVETIVRGAADQFVASILAAFDKVMITSGPESFVAHIPKGVLEDAGKKGCDHKFIGSNKCAKCGWVPPEIPPAGLSTGEEFERLYRRIYNRLIDEARIDPILLQLLTERNEIEVQVERRVVQIDGSSLKGRIARLGAGGFLKDVRKAAEVNRELDRTGGQVHSGNLGKALADFVTDGFLTREADGYRLAPGVKVSERELVAK